MYRYQLTDFATYYTPSTGCVLVVIPNSVLGVLRSMAYASLDDGRVYDTINNDGTVSLSDRDTYKDEIAEFLAMSNCQLSLQDLITSLNNVAQATLAASCCNAAGYQEGPNGELWYGTEEPTTELQSDAEERCRMANVLTDGWVINLRYAGGFTLAGIIGGAIATLVVFSLMGTPPIGVFLALAALGFSFVALQSIADYIETNKSDVVCAIYSAESYVDFMLYLEDLVIDIISSLEIEIYGVDVALLALFKAYWDTATWNRLHLGVDGLESSDPVDCSECDDTCPQYSQATGDGTFNDLGGGDFNWVGDSVQSGTWHYVTLRFGVLNSSQCGDAMTVTDIDTTGVTSASPASYRLWSFVPGAGVAGDIYNSNTLPAGAPYVNVVQLTIKSATMFTATVLFSES